MSTHQTVKQMMTSRKWYRARRLHIPRCLSRSVVARSRLPLRRHKVRLGLVRVGEQRND